MAICSSCQYDNAANAKMCGQCGSPLMSAGVGYAADDRGAPPPGPGFGGPGNMLPTIPEGAGPLGGGQAGPNHGGLGNVRVGGAASTVHEDAGAPGYPPPHPGGFGAGAGRTQLHDDVSKPVAGWLVVMRSRALLPYQDVPLYVGRNILGRLSPEAAQVVNDPNCSSNHVLILASRDGFQLTDLGSSNGTVVNNEKVQGGALNRGDRVRIGKTTFVFLPVPEPNDGRAGVWQV